MTVRNTETTMPDVSTGSRFGRLTSQVTGFPRSIWILAAAVLVLWTGRGMVVPFMIIFFTQLVGLPGTMVGSGIAISA